MRLGRCMRDRVPRPQRYTSFSNAPSYVLRAFKRARDFLQLLQALRVIARDRLTIIIILQ